MQRGHLLTAQIEQTASTKPFSCKRDVIENFPGRLYCEDGDRGGFLVGGKVEDDLVAEADSKMDVVAGELIIQLGEDGKLYAGVVGVRESP